MGKCSKKAKPRKPRKDFPLFPHASGQWARNLRWGAGRQRMFYFGPWSDPKAAEARWDEEKGFLLEGRLPPSRTVVPSVQVEAGEFCTVGKLCNEYMRYKQGVLELGELATPTFIQYHQTCKVVVDFFGKDRRADDIRLEEWAEFRKRLAKGVSASTLHGLVNRVRSVFKFAKEQRLIDREMTFGQNFKRPPAKKLREEKHNAGPNLLTRDEILRVLKAADPQMRAMILLGINAGLGNHDIARLEHRHLDLDGGWLDFPRPKTATPRRAKLWKETVAALQAFERPTPKDAAHKDRVFITRFGRPWVHHREKEPGKPETSTGTNAVTLQFGKLLKKLEINGRRSLGFYTLRHSFRTVADASKDQPAVDMVMGHTDTTMAGRYREKIWNARLEAVSKVVHRWLYAKGGEA